MTRKRIVPYKGGSKSAKALSKKVGALRIKPDNTRFIARNDDVIINWGASERKWMRKNFSKQKVINPPEAVSVACNKLETFEVLKDNGIPVPHFTTNQSEAHAMLEEEVCKRVFCRTKLRAHSGDGIVVARNSDEIVQAPLYVEGIAKDREFRIHVSRGEVFDFVEKKAVIGARELENWNPDIRSHSNGWVFTRQDVEVPTNVSDAAIAAVQVLGLDFAAVDICTQKNSGDAFVLEVNTSPALENTTLDKYANMIVRLLTE